MDRRTSLFRLASRACTLASALMTGSVFGQLPESSRPAELPASALPAVPPLRPSTTTSTSAKAALEKAEEFALGIPNPESARGWLKSLTEEPHVAGTPADYKTAVDVRDRLRSWGWTAELAEYEVLINYPRPGSAKLEILRPNPLSLKVIEDPNPLDKDSASPAAFPAFHGYGVSGEVAGQVVYANFGRIEDFEALEKLGISVKGKIVLVRYGELFRGLKVRNAQKRKAKGILIYSDPIDDGYMKGDVYPNGPFRPASALQRGSVQFLSLGPGDPSTPNTPSIKSAKRLPIDRLDGFTLLDEIPEPRPARDDRLTIKEWEKKTGLIREDYFATIPSLPISYESARPILESLGGATVPTGWQGGLPLTYHTGPGPSEVYFSIRMDYEIRPIWNVIATLKGSIEPERWVMIGNHRDAWVYGAADPSSGTAATLEMARALGAAVKNGWVPRRTLVYASWDAEEYGLVGSTEWADEHAKEISEKTVLMLNVDVAVSGPEIDLDGVPSLRDFLLDAAAKIPDVRSGKPLKEVWLRKEKARWASQSPVDFGDPLWDDDTPLVRGRSRPRGFQPQLNALGSGSDYTAFVDHLGVPAIDVGFTGRYGVYHAIYDNFYWMEKFCDPEFIHHATAAKLYTLLAMRAASLEVVPLRFSPYGEALRDSVDDYRRMLAKKSRAAEPGAIPAPLSFTGLNRLVGAVKEFQSRAAEADAAAEDMSNRPKVEAQRLSRFNDALTQVERAFLLPEGLPGRPWFRHSIYAPGLTTGYAAWVFPGVRQAIQSEDPEMFAQQVVALSSRIDAASTALKLAIKIAKEDDTRLEERDLDAQARPELLKDR